MLVILKGCRKTCRWVTLCKNTVNIKRLNKGRQRYSNTVSKCIKYVNVLVAIGGITLIRSFPPVFARTRLQMFVKISWSMPRKRREQFRAVQSSTEGRQNGVDNGVDHDWTWLDHVNRLAKALGSSHPDYPPFTNCPQSWFGGTDWSRQILLWGPQHAQARGRRGARLTGHQLSYVCAEMGSKMI